MSTHVTAGAPQPTATTQDMDPNRTPIRPLFDGPIDIIADVHGEYDALRQLLNNLGYDEHGRHREGRECDRRLVFLGDLVDRGPQNVSVVNLVRDLVDAGRAQCIIGNHELNLLRRQSKDGNDWFYGRHEDDEDRRVFDEVLDSDGAREDMLGFFNSLPMVLHRDDLRVVHACWDDASVEQVNRPATPIELFHEHERVLREEIDRNPPAEKTDTQLIFQNRNPVKVLTSGFEQKHPGFMHNGKMRYNRRAKWWNEYPANGPFCVLGHYSRAGVRGMFSSFDAGDEVDRPLGAGFCTCIDMAGGWRPAERREGGTSDYRSRLTALRWPQRELVDDLGLRRAMRTACTPMGCQG